MYERLSRVCPDVVEYRLYHVQSLLNAGFCTEAKKIAAKIDSPQFSNKLSMLKASIAFEQGDLSGCKSFLNDCLSGDPQTLAAIAALSFKNGSFSDARDLYTEIMSTNGFQPSTVCALALCHYMLHEYKDAVRLSDEIIERATKGNSDHFSTGSTGGTSLRYLEESFIIEANNIRAAIEYKENNIDNAKAFVTTRMPSRREEDIDAMTLHNQAIIFLDDDATTSFGKINFLLSNPPFPPEAFKNLLLLQCKYGFFDLAATTLEENSHLADKFLTQDIVDYFGASIVSETNAEDAFDRFDVLIVRQEEKLRKLQKVLSSASSNSKEVSKKAEHNFQQELEQYLALVMGQAKLIWQKGNYEMLERMLQKSADLLGDHEVWKLNMAHAVFMQNGSRFHEAIALYEPIVDMKSKERAALTNVSPIVLANLCVSYIMTNQNEAAEKIMKSVDIEEERLFAAETDQESDDEQEQLQSPLLHSCIINLVIGTLYCETGNFEFGISRVCKSLEPFEQKLGPETWFYSKRCLLALAEKLSKHLLTISDDTFVAIFDFLDEIELHGKDIAAGIKTFSSSNDNTLIGSSIVPPKKDSRTISFEARLLKCLYLKLRGV